MQISAHRSSSIIAAIFLTALQTRDVPCWLSGEGSEWESFVTAEIEGWNILSLSRQKSDAHELGQGSFP